MSRKKKCIVKGSMCKKERKKRQKSVSILVATTFCLFKTDTKKIKVLGLCIPGDSSVKMFPVLLPCRRNETPVRGGCGSLLKSLNHIKSKNCGLTSNFFKRLTEYSCRVGQSYTVYNHSGSRLEIKLQRKYLLVFGALLTHWYNICLDFVCTFYKQCTQYIYSSSFRASLK